MYFNRRQENKIWFQQALFPSGLIFVWHLRLSTHRTPSLPPPSPCNNNTNFVLKWSVSKHQSTLASPYGTARLTVTVKWSPGSVNTTHIFLSVHLIATTELVCLKILVMQKDRCFAEAPPPISGILIGRVWPRAAQIKPFSERNRFGDALWPAERHANHISKRGLPRRRDIWDILKRNTWHLADILKSS